MPRSQTQKQGPKDRSAQKAAPKRKSTRSLNALSIAEKTIHTKLGVKRSRLGAYDDGSFKGKRNTGDDDEDDEENTAAHYKRRRTEDTGSLDGGSDSEGHEWTLGQVNSDNDSELDSDEALGESDEERFEGFTFRASKSKSQPKKAAPKPKKPTEISLSEDVDESDEESNGEDYDEDDDLGEDAVDLATAWDMNVAAEEEEAQEASAKSKRAAKYDSDEDSGSEGDSESDASDDGLSISDDDDADPHGLSKLQDFVQSMETEKPTKRTQKSQEQGKHSEYGLTSANKLTVADLLPSITDSRLKNSLKHIDSVVQASKSGIPGKLDAPLAKRQQDRLDRTAAYEKSKETLNRWLETVKANRRAEHLSFPLHDPDAEQTHRLESAKPQTDLENVIQNILVESGLAEAEGKTAEDQIQSFEELQSRNIPIEEIQARRAELRKRRDLLFREEVRAKRIKKIKSKSYRRVHRKEREKMEKLEHDALMEAGVDMDDMDQEKNERLRAEARMGSKHRESKWAKGLKQTGRTAWDEEARNSAADLAQREEELRKRIEGKRVSNGDDDFLGSSSSESEDEDPWNEEGSDVERRKIQKKLSALESGNDAGDGVKGRHADLFEMKFMKNADAARKEQNDAELRQLNRELHGEDSVSEAESEVGRRKFGQSKKTDTKSRAPQLPKNEFEEKLDSDDEAAQAVGSDDDVDMVANSSTKHKSGASGNKKVSRSTRDSDQQEDTPAEEENPWLVQTERTNRRRTAPDAQESIDISLDATQPDVVPAKQQSKKQKSSKATVAKQQFAEDDSDDEEKVPVLLKNHDLVKRAFAGDEVVQEFEQDKMDTIEDEGDKVVDNTLPGWGSWAGEGVSKRQQKRQKRDLTTVAGVKPAQRKDAKLERVIINQKRVQKNKKYMASQLPHEFETKQQYERSLRLPLGPEWSTKETFQSGTKPRVMIKQGIIKPMSKPMQ
ncbi:Small-subunit processome, Utp14 [Penicillium griseofulvum]|uniref:Small-subunit processome, Utp14 n=1 Tax=Penicillium patulum TaxID=5078 RepID=A0A135LXA0_PENPA|nr:Small-subunit processome, Utp14 [Penicillium griseofulvum]KXG53590.1 Small-subunit processome, Utp14 [Penicillium griseofulvum]